MDDNDDDIDWQDDAILPPYQLNSATRRIPPHRPLTLLVTLTYFLVSNIYYWHKSKSNVHSHGFPAAL